MTRRPDLPEREDDLARVRAVIRGEDGAFERLKQDTAGIVMSCLGRAIAKRPASRPDRDDLLQSFYLFLLQDECRVLTTYSGRAALTTWMHSVAIRFFFRQTARIERRVHTPIDEASARELPTDAPNPEEATLTTARVTAVRALLDGLPDDDRVMLKLMYEQEASATVVGEVLSLSAPAVRMKKKRLFARLAAKLGGDAL